MKITSHLLLAAATLVAASSAQADTQAWNTGGPTDNWNTTDANWTGASTTWANGNDATFGGAGEAITLGTGITAHNLTFGSTGYSVATNTLTLTGTTPTISVTNLADSATISSILAGTAGLTKSGAGTLNLSGTNTLTGNLSVTEGILNYSTGTKLLANASGGTLNIADGATINLNGTNTNQLEAFGVWNIAGTLNNLSAHAQSLRSTNITLNGGTMHSDVAVGTAHGGFFSYLNTTIHAVGSNNVISGAGKFGINTGTTQTFNTATANDSLLVSTDLIHVGGTTFSHLTKTGAGTVTLSGANTYTGVTTISGGTLQLAKVASLYTGESFWTKNRIIVNTGGTLALNVGGANEFTTGNVTTLLTNLTTTINNNGLRAGSAIGFDTTNAAGGTFTVADNIANSTGTGSGSLGVTKLGTNTLTLSGANSYTGGTTVTAGTLNAANNKALGNGAVSVVGGTLAINSASVGQVTLGTGANLAMSSGKITIDITDASTFDKIVGTGTGQILLTGGTLELTGFSGFESNSYSLFSSFAVSGNDVSGLNITGYDDSNWIASLGTNGVLSFQAVPEPSTYGLIGAGALAAVAMVRRRRKHAGKVA